MSVLKYLKFDDVKIKELNLNLEKLTIEKV